MPDDTPYIIKRIVELFSGQQRWPDRPELAGRPSWATESAIPGLLPRPTPVRTEVSPLLPPVEVPTPGGEPPMPATQPYVPKMVELPKAVSVTGALEPTAESDIFRTIMPLIQQYAEMSAELARGGVTPQRREEIFWTRPHGEELITALSHLAPGVAPNVRVGEPGEVASYTISRLTGKPTEFARGWEQERGAGFTSQVTNLLTRGQEEKTKLMLADMGIMGAQTEADMVKAMQALSPKLQEIDKWTKENIKRFQEISAAAKAPEAPKITGARMSRAQHDKRMKELYPNATPEQLESMYAINKSAYPYLIE